MFARLRQLPGRRFLSASLLYAAGDLLTKAARFLLVPYYIHALAPAEVGQLAVLQAISLGCWMLFGGGWAVGVQRFYLGYDQRGDDFVATLWWTRLLLQTPIGLLLAATCFIPGESLLDLAPGLLGMTILAGCLRGGNNIIEAWYMIRREPLKQKGYVFLQFLTISALVIYLVSFRGLGLHGVVIGELLGYGIWTLLTAGLMLRAGRFDRHLPRWSELQRHCTPMLPHQLFMCGLASADRLIIKPYVSLADLAAYDVACSTASLLMVFSLSMRSAWLPEYFGQAEQVEGRRRYARTATVYMAVIGLIAAGLIVFAPEVMHVITGGHRSYTGAALLMQLVVAGLYGQSLFVAFNQPVIYASRIGWLALISGGSLLVNLGLNFWLVPAMGVTAAAWATLAAYALAAAAMFVSAQRVAAIPWEYGKLATMLVVVPVCSLTGCWMSRGELFSGLAGRLVVMLGLLAVLGFVLTGRSPLRLLSRPAAVELPAVSLPLEVPK